MESKPSPSNAAESPITDSDKDIKTSKKKSTNFEAPSAEKKQKVEKDIVRSLDSLALFEKPNEAKEKPNPTAETASEELTSEERQYVQQEIAKDHLQAHAEADPDAPIELDPAVDFLQRVEAGAAIEDAFNDAAAEAGLQDALEQPATNVENDVVGSIDTSTEDEGEIDWRTPPAHAAAGGAGGSQPPRGGAPGRGAPQPSDPNAVPQHNANVLHTNRYDRTDVLLVGVVSYLIGRRRGRIKTEKKLLPVQKKLERQVADLERTITTKEQQLSTAKHQTVKQPEQSPRMQPGRQETRLGLEKPHRAEHLGHMIVAAEAPARTKVIVERPNSIREGFRAEEVKDMPRNELLELSEKIVVEGASLRRIYESNLIGEKQLRHLVSEYLNGKDIRKNLRKEMVEREIDFERDPIMRDRIRSQQTSQSGGSGGLDQLLASVGLAANDDSADDSKRQAANDKRSQASKQAKAQHQHRVTDIATGTAIVVLSIIIVMLLVR